MLTKPSSGGARTSALARAGGKEAGLAVALRCEIVAPTVTDAAAGAGRLPALGDVYWVQGWVFDFAVDPKYSRPVVVVVPPRDLLDRLVVIARTSDTKVHGVFHPADRTLECDRDGVFALKFHHSAEAAVFLEPQARHCGTLLEPYLGEVLSMWENG